ncbi:AAA family ATPase [Candidatus Saccharibacteria bacterium]|nr:AAA family ATPase [Candidatus Saccharibacteria bacterium]MDQ5885227.1 ATP-dependent Clp protease ATP-binding subunit ClpB [Patescibacteria group bacterium]MDQ5958282.1 ATP-dependent Clp protease ATP-binding subunit ClpB [Patescibacteria group bacterium]
MQPQEQAKNPLQEYGIDMTALAKSGSLDPVIGRDEEIRRCMQILSRRTKNNPVLIGEPGVGKTAIVEGLAQRIVNGDVPTTLKNKRLISVEIGSLLAGASFRGQFEERIKSLLQEVEKSNGEIILFIDEIHTIVGAGKTEGSMDAANMLKPLLARGKLHLIGATTLNEYRQNVEKDAALERRFQPVYVGEPSLDDTIAILRGIQEKYEVHHGVTIDDDAVVAAARLSDRYINDRFLPDKAVDLLDEATSSLRLQLDSSPVDLDRKKRKIMQLEIELTALKKDKSEHAKLRKQEIEQEIKSLKDQTKIIEDKWQYERDLITNINNAGETIDTLKSKLEQAERESNLASASKIIYGDLPEAEKSLHTAQAELAKIPESDRLLREQVTSDDIATVVARWTGIPLERLLEGESQKLSHLDDSLEKRVIGQKRAIDAVTNAIKRSRAGISDEKRPIGSFLFLGPTGVGKTELAKSLAEQLFDDEHALIRIDMSEYMEQHAVARLIGSPPGYVGYEQGGQLTEAIRRRPYAVILFDEIEKAHRDVFNVLLQILDDGRLTDGQGRVVNFTNTIIIMTSNLGSDIILEWNGKDVKDVENFIQPMLQKEFRPELLNRIDDIIVFNKISKEAMINIVNIQINQLIKQLKNNKDISLRVGKDVKEMLAQEGYDPSFGARPLKRLIQTKLLNPIANLIITDKIKDGDNVEAHLSNGVISFK